VKTATASDAGQEALFGWKLASFEYALISSRLDYSDSIPGGWTEQSGGAAALQQQ